MSLVWAERYPGAAGIVPSFLSLQDSRSAREQINENYAHGGGWREFVGFVAGGEWEDPQNFTLNYPNDQPVRAKAYCKFREELVILFDYDWCAIVQRDGTCEVARLD